MHRHPFGPLPALGGVASWCTGGSRTVLSEPSEEMVERAATALWDDDFKSGTVEELARAALTAALFSSDVVAGEREET
jgi:hypothetical protein